MVLAFASTMLPAVQSDAGFVIDDFSMPGLSEQTISSGLTRLVSAAPPSSTTAAVGGGELIANNPGAAGTPLVKVFYGRNGVDLSAFSAIETFVSLGTITNNSSYDLVVSAFKNSSTGAGHVGTVTIAPTTAQSVSFFFSAVGPWNWLILDFESATGDAMNFSASGPVVLSTVPEPTSVALIGCALAGGLIARRRRKSELKLAV